MVIGKILRKSRVFHGNSQFIAENGNSRIIAKIGNWQNIAEIGNISYLKMFSKGEMSGKILITRVFITSEKYNSEDNCVVNMALVMN